MQTVPLDLTVLADHVNFLRSDHARFWTVNNVEYQASLPAVVLHDTGRRSARISQTTDLDICRS